MERLMLASVVFMDIRLRLNLWMFSFRLSLMLVEWSTFLAKPIW